jgi:hypothetical protein
MTTMKARIFRASSALAALALLVMVLGADRQW